MADVFLSNPGIQTDLENMLQASQQMVNAVEEFIALVQANLQDFTGMTADQLTQLLNSMTGQVDTMNSEFGKGASTLNSMVDDINKGDIQGATLLGDNFFGGNLS